MQSYFGNSTLAADQGESTFGKRVEQNFKEAAKKVSERSFCTMLPRRFYRVYFREHYWSKSGFPFFTLNLSVPLWVGQK